MSRFSRNKVGQRFTHTMVVGDDKFQEIAKEYPDVSVNKYNVDILTTNFDHLPD